MSDRYVELERSSGASRSASPDRRPRSREIARTLGFTASRLRLHNRAVLRQTPAIGAGSTQSGLPPLGGLPKRILDIVLAGIALLLAAPILAIVAGAIWLRMGRPFLFSQERIGHNGRPFKCLKFRTMVLDSGEVLKRHLAANPAAAREWQQTCKLTCDPRVTPLGWLLRKSSLDELPQIINILRGEMSCVGPRPVVPGELDRYGAYKAAYLRTRPGLTGIWQSSGRSKLGYEDRVALDVHYVNNWSMAQDLRIILRTVPALLKFDASA